MSSREEQVVDPSGDIHSARQEIARLNEKIVFLEKKLQLVGSVTRHDILNQMTAIVGYNELIGMMIEDPKLVSYLEKERAAIGRIRRQFQFAKEYQNIAVEPPRWQNIRNLVFRVAETVDVKNVRLTADTGNAAVLADAGLDKVFFYIFENTLRHGSTATEIRVLVTGDASRRHLVVEDNGPGIPEGEKEKIFERGYGKGTGWGLFIAREILAVTGMTLKECGTEGTGARFEIELPPGHFRENGE